ncbi:MAG: transporter substrate-binding domain-containing protein [Parachlamydiaceae bacterium]
MPNLLEQFRSSPAFKTFCRWGVIALLLIVAIWTFRSCTADKKPRKEIYKIGRSSSWYPIQLYGRERKLVAFTNDIIALIAQENKLRFEWVEVNPQTLMEGLESRNYDFAIANVRPNIINEDHYDFSELIFELGPVLIVKLNSEIASLENMNGRSIGITSGFSPIFNAIRTAGVNTFDPLIVTYNSANRALDSLVANQIDGVIMPAMEAYTATQGLYAGKLKVVTPPLNDEGLRIISLTSTLFDDIIDDINMSVNRMRANGSYDALITKWDLVDPETAFSRPSMVQMKVTF